MDRSHSHERWPGLVAVLPALNEEGSVGTVVHDLRAHGIQTILVADNGSTDRTAERAAAAGARVVWAPRRGYGSACLAGLAALPEHCRAVLFCDADGADDLDRLPLLVAPVLAGGADLVIGARVLGAERRLALSLPQRCGNLVAACLLRLLYRVRVRDLGPFRCIDRAALESLCMRDPAFGWTVEMQVKAYRRGLRVAEVPVAPRPRIAGQSKISGTVRGVVCAAWGILSAIVRHSRTRVSSC